MKKSKLIFVPLVTFLAASPAYAPTIADIHPPAANETPAMVSYRADAEPIPTPVVYQPVTVSEPETFQVGLYAPPKPEPTPTPVFRYTLTDAERDLIERVVMAEARGELYEGQMAVAQCILNACEMDNLRPAEAVLKYRYSKARPMPSQSVIDAVAAVFDAGETIIDEPIFFFYAPSITYSGFHESQIFVAEIGSHRFFARNDN